MQQSKIKKPGKQKYNNISMVMKGKLMRKNPQITDKRQENDYYGFQQLVPMINSKLIHCEEI